MQDSSLALPSYLVKSTTVLNLLPTTTTHNVEPLALLRSLLDSMKTAACKYLERKCISLALLTVLTASNIEIKFRFYGSCSRNGNLEPERRAANAGRSQNEASDADTRPPGD